MNQLLAGKRGIIFGALDSDSIAWKVAEKVYEAGGRFTLSNAPIALRMGQIQQLAEKCEATVIAADATAVDELSNLISESQKVMAGKLDFILHSIGMSPNVRKGKPYTGLDYDFLAKTLDVSAISFHKVMHVALTNNALNESASVLALTYIAAQRVFPDYGDMADAKALLESIARSFGYHLGSSLKVRVNTISQSPTKTKAGQGVKGFDEFFDYADRMSPLGNADAESCADFCVAMFSDLTRMVTMQNLYHDGGFSSMGMNPKVLGL